jgi:protein TonB
MPATSIAFLKDAPSRQDGRHRLSGALSISLAAHVGLALITALIAHRWSTTSAPAETQEAPVVRLVWLGGGGGGGDHHREPPSQLQRVGNRQAVAIAAAPQRSVAPSSSPTPPEVTQPAIASIDPVESGLRVSPGVSAAISQPGDFMGPGSGDGAGSGRKHGNGDGDGNGLGDGWREGTGGGSPGPGGEIAPVLVRQVRPNYTQAGMLARAQGVMRVEAVVLPDGTVGDVRIVGGFEPPFGLDQEALNAVRQWRFLPGRRQGRATPMLVSIELTFTLH